MTGPIKEYSVTEIKDLLRKMPELVHKAGQERIGAEELLLSLQGQLEIAEAKVRIKHASEDLRSKVLEAYVITDETVIKLKEQVGNATKQVEIAKLAYELADNKNLAIRKIANVNDTYQV
ncbi:MAG: hypothetical protein QME51_09885 [Planctomycetota bacterium]|nr:hypothetical protein [Planctomycetota bacterium]